MKNTKLNLDELKASNLELVKKEQLTAIKGGKVAGDPPPFG